MPISQRAKAPIRLVLALGLAAAASACDHSPERVGDNPRQVTVVGSGHVQGVPDTLTADVGIEFTARDVTAAMDQTNNRQQAVIDALANAGVDRKDISTTDVSLQPQYDNAGGTITGYRAANSIRVKIHPAGTASRLLAVIVGTGGDATRINSVSYSIADDSQLVKDARERSFCRRQRPGRAIRAAVRAGTGQDPVDLGNVGRNTPVPAPMRGGMASAVPLEPGQQTVSFSVTAVWELR